MASESIEISVIIATYKRSQNCRASVLSVATSLSNAGLNGEIVVGINGRDPETFSALEKVTSENKKIPLRVLVFNDRENPSGFRNKLTAQARGEWIYFIDDDAYVDPDFFRKFLDTRGNHPECVVIGGPNLTPPISNFFQRATGVALSSRFATYFSSARYKPRASKICGEESLILCNLFVKRNALGNDPFKPWLLCCEESFLLQEMAGRGDSFFYDARLSVWHERRPGPFSLARQVFRYGYGRGQILRLTPSRLRPAYVLPTLCVFYAFSVLAMAAAKHPAPAAYYSPFPLYAAFAIIAALRSRTEESGGVTVLAMILFPFIHFFYGWGVFWGLLRK